jgi:hypothetical protein
MYTTCNKVALRKLGAKMYAVMAALWLFPVLLSVRKMATELSGVVTRNDGYLVSRVWSTSV